MDKIIFVFFALEKLFIIVSRLVYLPYQEYIKYFQKEILKIQKCLSRDNIINEPHLTQKRKMIIFVLTANPSKAIYTRPVWCAIRFLRMFLPR